MGPINDSINSHKMFKRKNQSTNVDLPSSGTSRRCTMNFKIGLLPSNPGVHDTLIALCVTVSNRSDLMLVGANGNSITLNRAERVSFPPGDVTFNVGSVENDSDTERTCAIFSQSRKFLPCKSRFQHLPHELLGFPEYHRLEHQFVGYW